MTGITLDTEATDSQYSLAQTLAIWAVVSLPMLVLVFFVAPALTSITDIHPSLLIWYVGIIGMAWQFETSMQAKLGERVFSTHLIGRQNIRGLGPLSSCCPDNPAHSGHDKFIGLSARIWRSLGL